MPVALEVLSSVPGVSVKMVVSVQTSPFQLLLEGSSVSLASLLRLPSRRPVLSGGFPDADFCPLEVNALEPLTQ